MSDVSYEHVVSGKLNLKGGASLKSISNSKKSKKKKSKKKKRDREEEEKQQEQNVDDIVYNKGLTKAQEKHKKFKAKQEEKELKEIASKSYREHVEGYNQYLSNLSEHHDIPRISAAGNG